MKTIIEWLVRKYLPDWCLIPTKPELARGIIKKLFPGHHLSRNAPRGRRNKGKAVCGEPSQVEQEKVLDEAIKEAMKNE